MNLPSIRNCLMCQQVKADCSRFATAISCARSRLEGYFLGFHREGLLLSGGRNNCILVVADCLSKYCMPVHSLKHHSGCRLPWCLIVIDFLLVHCGRNFLSWQRWISTWVRLITHNQAGRSNAWTVFETFLHCFVHACLELAEFWYNTSFHSALGLLPVWRFVCHALQHFGLDPAGDSPSSNLEEWLHSRGSCWWFP